MCDTFIILKEATQNGGTIFAKNSDRQFNEAQYLEILPARQYSDSERLSLTYIDIDQISNTHEVLLSKPHWLWGAEIGANEHGLVIGNEAIFSKIPPEGKDGIIGMDLLRLALERASHTDEAIQVITGLLVEHGQGGNCGYQEPIAYDNAFLISDGNTTKILETAGRDWAVRTVDHSDAISNVMTTETDIVESSSTLEQTAHQYGFRKNDQLLNFKQVFEDKAQLNTGEERRYRALNLISEKSSIDLFEAFKMTRDHGESESQTQDLVSGLCMHKKKDTLGKTTASMVSLFRGAQIVHWVTATGAPCTSVFKPILLELGTIPEHGPKPGADEGETDSLWWRHERLSACLLDPEQTKIDAAVFEHDRDVLEMELVALMEACLAVVSPKNIDQRRSTVKDCWQKALEFEDKWYAQCVGRD